MTAPVTAPVHARVISPTSGSGGTGWFDPPFARPALIGPRDAYAIGEHCSGGPEWFCCAIDGLAGRDAAFVELDDAEGGIRHPIESPLGAFIACTDGNQKATLRVLDAAEIVLFEGAFGFDM